MAEKSILELHDARYKAIFSHPRAVEDLLRLLILAFGISPEWMARLMFETLERVPSEWIDKKSRRKYGDLVWRLKLRDECLNEMLFDTLSHARSVLDAWRHNDNHDRPHSTHGGATPAEFAAQAVMGHAPSRLAHPARPGQHTATGLYF